MFNAQAEPAAELIATIDGVTIETAPVVEFTVTDNFGRGAVGLRAGSSGGNIRFTLAKLQEGADGDPDTWQSYINRERGGVAQATYDRSGPLEDHGDGTYTYTFDTDVSSITEPVEVAFEPSLTHRIVLQISGRDQPPVNLAWDFVPEGDEVTTTRDIVTVDSCNQCHNQLRIHGSRYETDYCVTCHNPGTLDSETGLSVDLGFMVHKIHMGNRLPSVQAGGTYVAGGHDYSEVGYPQSPSNCRKCHNEGIDETPDGDNWRNVPTIEACGSCHDDVNFADGTNHVAGRQEDNSLCTVCHTPSVIETSHASPNITVNNPNLPPDLTDIAYEIVSVSVTEGDQPIIDFNITRDGEPLDLLDLPADLTEAGRYPSFLLAYALPQDGVEEPADLNNLGEPAGQPISVGLQGLIDGSGGTLVDNGDYFTATPDTAFPSGARLRTVALQGYFAEVIADEEFARHAVSVVATVEGDTPRRDVIDTNGCANCHEIFEAHGGNRVISAGSDNVCVMCHVPNLSSSGRTLDLESPEATNNFRDMIHGIHASAVRQDPYVFVRAFRGSARPYDWSHVTFPGILNDCNTCHLDGTFELPLPDDLLPTTDVTRGEGGSTEAVSMARETLPNDNDLVISPTSSVCVMCHDGAAAAAHMEQNGGAIRWTRQRYAEERPTEACAVCHDAGSLADVSLVHGLF